MEIKLERGYHVEIDEWDHNPYTHKGTRYVLSAGKGTWFREAAGYRFEYEAVACINNATLYSSRREAELALGLLRECNEWLDEHPDIRVIEIIYTQEWAVDPDQIEGFEPLRRKTVWQNA